MKVGLRGPRSTTKVEETLRSLIGMLWWLRIKFQMQIVETVLRHLMLEVAAAAMVQKIMTMFPVMMAEATAMCIVGMMM
jgi:hypothetical protein